ncbi:hypothetical protein F7734_19875 [Scytonema sp. UIC 10036]|uniref:hypothetical protein n=1 Tax=Scytonema sp. UIC 10036 TaxID=2304196 RepID=UPI0012DABAE1|nr:hypothetical protein [Scytonema sp. UIC 10036]MUG94512.1 hypothetical protein [Scytonema sp. UIC 10036]
MSSSTFFHHTKVSSLLSGAIGCDSSPNNSAFFRMHGKFLESKKDGVYNRNTYISIVDDQSDHLLSNVGSDKQASTNCRLQGKLRQTMIPCRSDDPSDPSKTLRYQFSCP